ATTDNQGKQPIIISVQNEIAISNALGYQFQLFNMQGAVIFEETLQAMQYQKQFDLPAGMYIASIQNQSERISEMIVLH
ncbi:MAG TPA: T9SS type A sorting domain-containing protein, partial [Chitinophagales bacterium]|nr:T9SS type A sorting domain-containing protein [Chitinophagales bacterium]